MAELTASYSILQHLINTTNVLAADRNRPVAFAARRGHAPEGRLRHRHEASEVNFRHKPCEFFSALSVLKHVVLTTRTRSNNFKIFQIYNMKTESTLTPVDLGKRCVASSLKA